MAPKPLPLTWNWLPGMPLTGVVEFTTTEATLNVEEELELPPTVTLIAPLVAPVGTFATICVSLQLVMDAVTLLKETELVPCVEPKPLPVIVTGVLTRPPFGEKSLT